MNCQKNILVVDPPTVIDSYFNSYTPQTTCSFDVQSLSAQEFDDVLSYLRDINDCLRKISRVSWEGNVIVHIQKDCTNISCEAKALTAENQQIIDNEMDYISQIAAAIENVLENYALLKMQKHIEIEAIHTQN